MAFLVHSLETLLSSQRETDEHNTRNAERSIFADSQEKTVTGSADAVDWPSGSMPDAFGTVQIGVIALAQLGRGHECGMIVMQNPPHVLPGLRKPAASQHTLDLTTSLAHMWHCNLPSFPCVFAVQNPKAVQLNALAVCRNAKH